MDIFKKAIKKAWEHRFKILSLLFGIAVISAVGLVLYWAIWADISPQWTGLGAYDEEARGPRAKTLWDWMGLLLVPAILVRQWHIKKSGLHI